MEIRYIKFSELRSAYLTVQEILKTQISIRHIHSLNFKIEKDGQICGDDVADLLMLFSEKYEVDFTDFDFNKHFTPEGFNPLGLIYYPIYFAFRNIFEMYLLYFKGRKKLDAFKSKETKLLDLTFGDLLTSFLEKKFTYRHQVKYVLIR